MSRRTIQAALFSPLILTLPWAPVACRSPGVHDGINAPVEQTELDPGALLPLSTNASQILDAEGREVILRGLQHHALQDVDYGGRDVVPEDYALIASWGFTTLRMAISWSRIEPEPGVYDGAYLDEVRDALDRAQEAGLVVILEWHQDLWGRCSQEPGSTYAVNANGAPDWTCPDDYEPSVFGHWQLFDRFWDNEDGVRDAFVDAWGVVIDALGDHPAVAGYDVINEPQGSADTPDLELEYVFPAFREIVPALRDGGAGGILLLDATIMRNETFQMATEPLSDIGPDLVYAPHLYSGWTSLYLFQQRIGVEDKQHDFAAAARQGEELELPVFNGEWAVNLNLDGALEDAQTHASLEDAYAIGSSWWAFEQAVPGQGDDSISGAQAILDEERVPRQELVDILGRPYPIAAPGKIIGFSYDAAGASLAVEIDADGSAAPVILHAPRRLLGEVICLDAVGGGAWTWDEDAARERVYVRLDDAALYTVTLGACPDGDE